MHLIAQLMLSKIAATVPSGIGGIPVFAALPLASRVPQSRVFSFDNNYSIHSFINLTHSL